MTAFDMLDQIHIAAALYATGDEPGALSERVWARTATSRGSGCTEATDWIREVLHTTESAL